MCHVCFTARRCKVVPERGGDRTSHQSALTPFRCLTPPFAAWGAQRRANRAPNGAAASVGADLVAPGVRRRGAARAESLRPARAPRCDPRAADACRRGRESAAARGSSHGACRALDAQMRGRRVGVGELARVELEPAQSERHRLGVVEDLRGARVGEELAPARQSAIFSSTAANGASRSRRARATITSGPGPGCAAAAAEDQRSGRRSR